MSPVARARMGWVDRAFAAWLVFNQSLGAKGFAFKCQVARLAALIGLFRVGGPSCFRTKHQTKAVQAAPTLAPGAIKLPFASLATFRSCNLASDKISIANLSSGATRTLLDFVLGYSTTEDLASQLPQSNKVDCTDSTSLPKTCP